MCYEESFLAALDYFFDMNGKLRKNASKYTTGNVLSLDIGASTSDLVIVQDMKYLEHTGQTVKIGGNVARQYMQNWVSQTYGFDAPDETLERAIAEGRLQMGNGYVECSEAVCSAKKELARDIVNHITNYFRAVNIPIQMLRAIVVSGGGSMPGSYVDEGGNTMSTSPSVTKYITEYLLDVCPDVEVEQMERNPRMSNIHGLFVRAKLDTVVCKAANGSGRNSKIKGNNAKADSEAASKGSDSAEDSADNE